MDLGWVDFDLGVPPSCSAAQPLLPLYHGFAGFVPSGRADVSPECVHKPW